VVASRLVQLWAVLAGHILYAWEFFFQRNLGVALIATD
jgi:hypothetical protein